MIDFEPMRKISQTLSKDRDFSNIQFADLHNDLEVNGDNITINKMEIRSTVLVMYVEGNYSMTHGPDLSIRVPLSNLGKIKKDSVLANQGIHSKKGVSALLRAQNRSDGKLKISWDPFNKGRLKEKTRPCKKIKRHNSHFTNAFDC